MVNLDEALDIIIRCVDQGGKIMTCGNGGSAADSEHICAELSKGFLLKRPLDPDIENLIAEKAPNLTCRLQRGIFAISLTSNSALTSAIVNDIGPDAVFAQQLIAFGKENDVLIAISTSGKSSNVIAALNIARIIGVKTILLTGKQGRNLNASADVVVCSKESRVDKIQEDHIRFYHDLCRQIEIHYYGD